MRGVVFFDVDGTLTAGTSSGAFIARALGHYNQYMAAEQSYEVGSLSNEDVCRVDARGWKGVAAKELDEILTEMPLVEGIAETVAWCRNQSLGTYLSTLAWRPVAKHLASRFGFAGYGGPVPALQLGRYTGMVDRFADEYSKRDDAILWAQERGVGASRCAAIGDSRSDLPLFAAVGLGIGFNPTPVLRSHADFSEVGSDLRTVIPILEPWAGQG